MHVLPDSFNDLTSPCLPRNPWREFPFTTFVAMLAAVLTLLVDSLMLTFYNRRRKGNDSPPPVHAGQYCHGHDAGIVVVETETVPRPDDADNKDQVVDVEASKKKQLLRNRVIVQVLELGIVVHSVVIGVGMGHGRVPEHLHDPPARGGAVLPPAVRGHGPGRLHPAGGVRRPGEVRAGVLLLDHDAVRGGAGAGAHQGVQRQQPHGARRGGPAQRGLRGAAALHGARGPVGCGLHGAQAAVQRQAPARLLPRRAPRRRRHVHHGQVGVICCVYISDVRSLLICVYVRFACSPSCCCRT
ncbi:hypothetical protein PR202_gb11481 [Eleusine coracana subsp. coracana]|uniref:Uncharacterized protein n=1 Tax=Eleusine coracana subsp. coracana TaxID=191504 RepID=A0AAV5ENE3_ELECO|nr:hypothetical protein PR202_gb11481 [Eleusine coracana subsp. coracana]